MPLIWPVQAAPVVLPKPPVYIKPIKTLAPLPQTKLQPQEQAAAVVIAVNIPPTPTITDVVNCGSDPYMAQIYTHESGCSTTRTNSIGCVGLGQACPGSKLYAVCPTLDWNCENNFFINYANAVYGSPALAWAAWQVKHWW